MTIKTDEQGYLTDFSQWNKEVATTIAHELDIDLTDKHWQVIEYIQVKHRKGIELTVRSMGQSGIVSIAVLYQLFPGGPLKYAYKIAGLPRPKNCI
jgi:TusE/DsrC/DsvC family sulfur relay protein